MVNWSRLSAFTETAAPSSALPMGSTRVLSATRLTRVDPSAPANVHRLHNAVLGLVIVSDADKREDLPPRKAKKSLGDGSVKQENGDGPTTTTTEAQGDTAVKEEDGTGVVKTEGNAEAHDNDDDEDEDEDEEPIWKEEIGWREVCGFLTMYVFRLFPTCPLLYKLTRPLSALFSHLVPKSIPPSASTNYSRRAREDCLHVLLSPVVWNG